ncbi:hypothetical protein TCAL_03905 [Tigriopus californicus]|uniref:limulus clotting factor C n=1 Tax=Tigriopus californicus TaxID=6832 RepID=A0A553NF90_TIGCA|nr:hypothetical protein TCAL_03905 [Tigriopus californicus]
MAEARGIKANSFDILFNPSGKNSVVAHNNDRLILTPETLKYNLQCFQGPVHTTINHHNHHYYPYPNQVGPLPPPKIVKRGNWVANPPKDVGSKDQKKSSARGRWYSDTCVFMLCIVFLTLAVLILVIILLLREFQDRSQSRPCSQADIQCQTLSVRMECGLANRKTMYTPTPASQTLSGQLTQGVFTLEKVVGGEEVEVNEYPWQVALEPLQSESWTYRPFCGGTLMNDEWVMTAAHCFKGQRISRVQVVLGDHDVTNMTETTRVIRTVRELIIHPDYSVTTNAYDLALLRLDDPIPFEYVPNVRPICFPLQIPENGEQVVVSGWGKTNVFDELTSDVLREATLTVIDSDQCEALLSQDIKSSMICAGDLTGARDSCSGDSGGPLMQQNGVNYEIVGVTSWGIGRRKLVGPDYRNGKRASKIRNSSTQSLEGGTFVSLCAYNDQDSMK